MNLTLGNLNHTLAAVLPEVRVPARLTRRVVSVHSRYLDVPRSRTVQFSRLFVPACAQYLNTLDKHLFSGDGDDSFKSHINRPLLFG